MFLFLVAYIHYLFWYDVDVLEGVGYSSTRVAGRASQTYRIGKSTEWSKQFLDSRHLVLTRFKCTFSKIWDSLVKQLPGI